MRAIDGMYVCTDPGKSVASAMTKANMAKGLWMSVWWWFVLGALISAPVWIGTTVWVLRRLWKSTLRLSARTRTQGHLAEVGQLVGGLAHEIKNPLSTVNVNLQLLAEDLEHHHDELHDRWLRRIQSVQHEAKRLKDTLDEFLRFAGKIELSLHRVDLRVLLEELSDFFAPQAQSGKVILRTALSEQPILCLVDVNMLKQALLNLMLNAVQAMPEGGELLVKLFSHHQAAIVEVIDTGVGIPPENLSKVFQAYYSTKRGGSGLGLPMTRRIIEEHDGSIRAESEPGKGTRFIIELPLARQK